MSDMWVIVLLVFASFLLVGFVGWFAYRGGYVAGYEDAIAHHNLAARLRWRNAENRPATRDADPGSFPYRGEIE